MSVLFLLERQRLYRNDEDLVDKVILLSVYYFFLKDKGCTENDEEDSDDKVILL